MKGIKDRKAGRTGPSELDKLMQQALTLIAEGLVAGVEFPGNRVGRVRNSKVGFAIELRVQRIPKEGQPDGDSPARD